MHLKCIPLIEHGFSLNMYYLSSYLIDAPRSQLYHILRRLNWYGGNTISP
jgi:hypothetical protein